MGYVESDNVRVVNLVILLSLFTFYPVWSRELVLIGGLYFELSTQNELIIKQLLNPFFNFHLV